MRKWVRGLTFTKIRTQIMAYYIVLLSFSLLVSGFLYQQFNRSLIDSKIAEVSEQSLYAIQSNMNSLFESISNYSQRVIASSTVQELLQDDMTYDKFVYSNQRIQKELDSIFLAETNVASVNLFRNDGLYYSLELQKVGLKNTDIRTYPWYEEAVGRTGGLLWRINAGGLLNTREEGEQYLSLIRVVNDLNTARQIGLVIINVPISKIHNLNDHSFDGKKYDLMVNSQDLSLIDFSNPGLREFAKSTAFGSHANVGFTQTVSGKRYLFDTIESRGWRYTTALSMSDWPNPYGAVNRVLIPIALFHFVFLFLGSTWITRSIIRPILNLLKSMRKAEAGDYQQVVLQSRSSEFLQLQDRYNSMITTIESSMEREKEEQNLRRKLELDILQQQIKPHFLYNALESAGYLALAGNKEETYGLISALGQYYRLSLSKGSEIVTLREEFDIARNYLKIQHIRYPGMFTVEYELDERLKAYPIPKLTLQPLIENALYHGIRPTALSGMLNISAKLSHQTVVLTIEDDGVGISEEELASIREDQLVHNAASFGLRGTITRFKLFYGDDMSYQIASSPGDGTTIIINLPYLEDSRWITGK
ncbi:cache domain-containing sensor histidine kinase [Cohnella mopanensis]|uniref:cache domain-containing sensor histidine kinase n=1 Tax=Cohnella mopanensis TaxID=2911966 RepID=UPI001EF99F1E|nr:sensor histidine kinase [Cohnella mopanensis]